MVRYVDAGLSLRGHYLNSIFSIERTAQSYPVEWFGGVDPSVRLLGEGNVVETDRHRHGSSETACVDFLPERVPVTIIDPPPSASEEFELAPTGRFSYRIAGGTFTLIEGFGQTFSVGSLTTDATSSSLKKTMLLDNRSRGFGGNFGFEVEYNEQADRAILIFPIFDVGLNQVGQITQTFELLSIPDADEPGFFGPVTAPQALKVTWSYQNLAGPKSGPGGELLSDGSQSFGMAHLYKPRLDRSDQVPACISRMRSSSRRRN